MTTTPGLRERKKAETRQAVYRAALHLIAEHGFDNVTVEAIADVANISRRTFFNYFADKADAVMYGEEDRHRRLLEKFRARPADEGGWQALRRAAEELIEEYGEPDREWVLRVRLARRHPVLLARQLAGTGALERELVQDIAERDGDGGLRARVLAGSFLAALRIASAVWLEEDQSRGLTETTMAALDELDPAFGG
ncbi:TetR/AcrR family transcriptional regulator [Actinocorallia populi]|uniref:TetR/AcrR family transcriptional regulator n=1 Tax=Actinocorallia populi TaxID=2079200 RepID=UPI000D0868F0|nr:TetR family transcriptional regulator [Actinocorallia populi]